MKRFFLVVWGVWLLSGVAYGEVHRYELVGNGRERGMYDAGIFLEALTKVVLRGSLGFYVEPRFTEGEGESLEVLLRDRVGFGMVKGTSLRGSLGYGGGGEVDEKLLLLLKDEVRVVVVLWREVLHGLIRKERVQSGTWSDLRALDASRIVVGGGDSGFAVRRGVLPFLGWGGGEGELMSVWGEGEGEGKGEGKDFEGVVWVSGVRSREVRDFMVSGDWIFLDTTRRQGMSVERGSGGTWRVGRLEEGTYEGTEGDRDVLSQFVYLVALKGLSSEDVYGLTKSLFEEMCTLREMSGLFHSVLPLEEQVGRGEGEWAWHEGAKRYYEERSEGGDLSQEPCLERGENEGG